MRGNEDAVLDEQGAVAAPRFGYDQLVAVYEGAWADDPQVGRITGLLVLNEGAGYAPVVGWQAESGRDCWWAYEVLLAGGVGDTICVAEELVALAEAGGGGGR